MASYDCMTNVILYFRPPTITCQSFIMEFNKGDAVKIKGSNLFGKVVAQGADNMISVKLDNGAYMHAPESLLTPVAETATPETHDHVTGRFKKGHKPMANASRKRNQMKYCRETILSQLQPFLEDLGTLIEQIDEPGDKILAISRIMPYSMPKLATVEVKDKEPRNLNAEERIAKLNAAYHGKPDPTEEEEEE